MVPKGKTLLKVVGILYIIFSAISIIGGVLMIAGGGLFLGAGAMSGEYLGAGIGGVVAVVGVVMILSSVLGLVAGILGVKNCARPEKANVCFVLGIVLLVFAALNLVSSIANGSGVWSAVIGLALPVLYTVGAYQNKQSVGDTTGAPMK